ncbi:aldose 1-epimerase [Halteromyces radiatus]|uniref:aldose 1-epimerase n=1 Tax=Halteromyces radiatus TaxID=101107 RepID=UPI002220BAE8|nr:aldose 1-epimerase [Halteromyces radiatus]KAI8085010.1 aldose 1-epimerase [Halteromyces radiatus]
MTVTKLNLSADSKVDQYTLINENKTLAVMVLNYGAIISHILTPDKTGKIRDVVLGFDDYESYKSPHNRYFGAVVGRFANRIGQGKFTVDGQDYVLATNNGSNALHGGECGFDKQLWQVEILSQQPASIQLTYVSPDGDQGYPGTLTTHVTYTVNNDDTLTIDYHATLSKRGDDEQLHSTIVNLTNHTYFNLAGVAVNPVILDTKISMTDNVKGYLELDETGVPTGKELSWSDTPCMNFTGDAAGTTIGKRIQELVKTKGYDHPYVLHHEFKTDTSGLPLQKAVEAYSPETGIQLTFSTTEPAFQFYTGNWLESGHIKAKKSQDQVPIEPYAGFCLESSRFPDAPNKPDWRASVLLQDGDNDVYASRTVFGFQAINEEHQVVI